ncbi:MAG: helix-turn-helix domain-containing protein [Clostridia bacterium]|nr:helix-turn-helix domain-containing protein [Clostridia bacterium]
MLNGKIYGRYNLVYLHAWHYHSFDENGKTYRPKNLSRQINGFVYFREGRATLREDNSGRAFTIEAGDLVFFPMNVPYAITWDPGIRTHDLADFLFDYNCHMPNRSERGVTTWETLRMSQKDSLPSFLPAEKITLITNEPVGGTLDSIFTALLDAYRSTDDYTAFTVNARFYKLIDYVHSALYPSEAATAGSEIDRARLYIEAHCTEECSVAEIAKQYALDRSYFSRRFKEIVGMPPTTYKNLCRMRLAREMLISTTRSVAEITDLLGFSSEAHFRECFRREYGQSPLQFRKENSSI